MKKYKISIDFSGIVESKNEEEAKEEFRKCIDNTFFKLDCKELK